MFIASLILVALIGYLAQSIGLCMVRGVKEATSGKPSFLLAILLSGSFSWISISAAHFSGLEAPSNSHALGVMPIVGGLLFGVGAAFNNGCGVSTISKLARGHAVMIFTVVGWLIGWLIEVSFFPSVKLSGYQVPPQLHYVVLIGLSIVVLGFIIRFGPTARRVWISMMTIGLIAGVVFLFEPKWTPSGLLKDISVSLWSNSRVNWPTFERFALIGALVSGMVVAAVMTRSFQLQAFKSKEVLKNIRECPRTC